MKKTILGAYLLGILLLTGCADKGTLGQSTPVNNSEFSSEKNRKLGA
ncbi:MAG: hypothetical protein HDT43_09010 [Ruminococcaceae bacterium]|nr:hypothetical protein [Oscillospiraceae bacterium]